MGERKTVILTGGPVHRLPAHLVFAEQVQRYDEIGDCAPCRGTGTIVVVAYFAGRPHTPVKACPSCLGTGWLDRVERVLRVAAVRHHLPVPDLSERFLAWCLSCRPLS